MRRWLGLASFLVLLLRISGEDDRSLEELVLYAGAGVGAVLVAVIIVLIVCCCKQHRKRDKKSTLRDSDSRAQKSAKNSRKLGTKSTEREGGTQRVVAHSPPPPLSPHRTALSPHPPKAISPLPKPDPAIHSATPDWQTYENCTIIGIRKSVK